VTDINIPSNTFGVSYIFASSHVNTIFPENLSDRNVAEKNAFKLDRVDIHKQEETLNEFQSRAETWTMKRLKAGLVEKSWAQQAQEKAKLVSRRYSRGAGVNECVKISLRM